MAIFRDCTVMPMPPYIEPELTARATLVFSRERTVPQRNHQGKLGMAPTTSSETLFKVDLAKLEPII